MYLNDHIGTLGSLLIHFQNFLDYAPPEHIELLERIVNAYDNQGLHAHRADAEFPAMVIEIASLWAEVGEHGRMGEPSEYKDVFGSRDPNGNPRARLAIGAAIQARLLPDEEFAELFERFHNMTPRPVAVEAKPKRRKRRAAAAALLFGLMLSGAGASAEASGLGQGAAPQFDHETARLEVDGARVKATILVPPGFGRFTAALPELLLRAECGRDAASELTVRYRFDDLRGNTFWSPRKTAALECLIPGSHAVVDLTPLFVLPGTPEWGDSIELDIEAPLGAVERWVAVVMNFEARARRP